MEKARKTEPDGRAVPASNLGRAVPAPNLGFRQQYAQPHPPTVGGDVLGGRLPHPNSGGDNKMPNFIPRQ